jgi:phosphatidate cytidylyltransferase
LVAGAIFLAVLCFGGEVLFCVLMAAIAVVGMREYGRIANPSAMTLDVAFGASWAGVLVLGFCDASRVMPGLLLAVGSIAYLGAWMAGAGPREDLIRRWGALIGGWVFVALFLGHAVWVREHGISPVLFLAAIVWFGDTAAYYVGSAIGSTPLAPLVSPKKSVEGAVASLLAGAFAAAVTGLLLPVPHSLGMSLLLGVVLNAAAQLGDLAESLFKRCGGVKDSGSLFPGHGGILDRLDGFLFSLPLYAAFLVMAGG